MPHGGAQHSGIFVNFSISTSTTWQVGKSSGLLFIVTVQWRCIWNNNNNNNNNCKQHLTLCKISGTDVTCRGWGRIRTAIQPIRNKIAWIIIIIIVIHYYYWRYIRHHTKDICHKPSLYLSPVICINQGKWWIHQVITVNKYHLMVLMGRLWAAHHLSYMQKGMCTQDWVCPKMGLTYLRP